MNKHQKQIQNIEHLEKLIIQKYELIRIDGNARGTIESTEDINVTYVYKLKDAKVNVKYLDVTESETGTPLSSRDGTTIEDKVINGQVDDAYRTQEAEKRSTKLQFS